MTHGQYTKISKFFNPKMQGHTHTPTCTCMHAQEHLGKRGHVNSPLPCHTQNTTTQS
jgi:hypothetical protein